MKPISVLPHVAVAILKKAAGTPIPPNDPLARTKAIEEATSLVRSMFPQHFQPEEDYYGKQANRGGE